MATLLALAQFVIGWKTFALYYLLPYATTYQIFRYWSDAADHAGVNQSEDELHRSRNHVFWGPVNWLLFPRSDQYHLVHHLFPVLPTRHLRRVHDMLMTEPAYAEMNHSGAQLLDTE
jgi:fatty acid desaturase